MWVRPRVLETRALTRVFDLRARLRRARHPASLVRAARASSGCLTARASRSLPVPIRRQGYRVAHRLLRSWWFIARPQVQGVKCMLTCRDQVLLVRHTYGRDEWDLPGGGIRRDELPPDAARREMEEELSIQLDELRPLGVIHARPYRSRDRIHCFQASLSAPEVRIDEGELAAAKWFPLTALPRDLSRYVPRVLALAD